MKKRDLVLLSTGLTALFATSAQAQSAPALTQPEPTWVEPLTVLATRSQARTDEVPATVTVITAREIETNLYTDIKDLVRFEPGVSVPTAPARFGAALGSTGRDGNAGFTILSIERFGLATLTLPLRSCVAGMARPQRPHGVRRAKGER